MKSFLNKVFKLEENGTTIKTELIAGLTTFFAMCYIIVVNPTSMISGVHDGLQNAVYVGGILAAAVATICMAFIAKRPFALAAGMGLNSFFFVSFILPALSGAYSPEDGFAAGLAIILVSGLIFLALSITGARKFIATSLPKTLKAAIPAGIGGFIAFIGFQNAGLVTLNPYTLVQFVAFKDNWTNAIPAVIAFVSFIAIVVFARAKNKVLKGGAVVWGILVGTALYYIAGCFFEGLVSKQAVVNLGDMFRDWGKYGFSAFKGFGVLAKNADAFGGLFAIIMLVVTYCLVDMFDTVGTIYGASASVGMLDENGDPLNIQEEMLCDSIGTCVGALTGTSTITTFVESSAGIAAGGRTGLTALVTGLLFLVCLPLGAFVNYIPGCATAAALIYVGVLMFKNVTNVDWTDARAAATAFITIIMMVCTYSITNGIMIGAMTYVLFTIFTRKFEKKDIVVSVIALLGLLRFVFVTM